MLIIADDERLRPLSLAPICHISAIWVNPRVVSTATALCGARA